jgi:hypothetical protein
VTNVIQGFDGVDVKTGICRHAKLLSRSIGSPVAFALDADTAFACIDFHDLCGSGIKDQRRWKNHPDGFFAAIGKNDGMGNAFTIKINIGLLDDADLVELGSHVESLKEEKKLKKQPDI